MMRLILFLLVFASANCSAQVEGHKEVGKPYSLYSLGCTGEVFTSNATREGLLSATCFEICVDGQAVASLKQFGLVVNQNKYFSQSCSMTPEMKTAIKAVHPGQKIHFTDMVVVGGKVCPRALPDKVITIVN